MIQPLKYARRPFFVDGIQVTADNLDEVATWCNGAVIKDDAEGLDTYIKVPVKRPLNDKQTQASVGDWVLKAGTGFKVYTAGAFKKNFEPTAPVLPSTPPVPATPVVSVEAGTDVINLNPELEQPVFASTVDGDTVSGTNAVE